MKSGERPFAGLERISLPQKVAELLRQDVVASLKPGDRLEGMHLLRQRFGVSINTVSAALDLLASDGVVEKKHGSGVYVAEHAHRRRIGILSELNLLDPRIGPFFRAEADALKAQLARRGDEPVLYVGDAVPGSVPEAPTCPQFWSDAASGRLDSAIILNLPYSGRWDARVQECQVPAVGSMTGFDLKFDFEGMVHTLVERLAGNGCRRIGLIAWHMDDIFRRALEVHGLKANDAWIRCERDPAVRGAGWDEFREIWLAQEERPDGLLILDDMLFADAQLAMFELGVRVPQDLQLALQTTRGATLLPRLPATIFEIDAEEVAAAHIALLDKRMDGISPNGGAPVVRFHERRDSAATAAVEDRTIAVVGGVGR